MASRLTAEMLADLEVPHDVRISPSGQQVVYNLRSDSNRRERWVSSLWLADVGKEHSARKLTGGGSLEWEPQWSSDSKSIAFVSDRAKEGATAVIYLQSIDGGDATALTSSDNEANISTFAWSPDGKYIAYLSPDEKSPERKAKEGRKDDPEVYGENWQFNRLRCVNVHSKQIATLVSKQCHVCEFVWSPDSKTIAYGTQRTPEIQSPSYHGTTLQTVTIQDRKVSDLILFPTRLSDLCWAESDLWWRATYDLTNTMSSNCVYGMSTESKDWSRRSYGVTNDATPFAFPPGMRSTPAGLIVQVLAGLQDQLHILPSGRIIYDEMHQVKSWDVTLHDNKPLIALIKSSPSNPSEVFSVIDGIETCLSNHGTEIAKLDIAVASPFYATASDGTTIDALLYTPKNHKLSKPYPTIVFAHGGPIFRLSIAFDPELQQWIPWFVSLGYAVLAPNYGGSYSHGDSFTARVRGRSGHEDYSDLIAVVNAAIAEGTVDKDKCAIGGYSAGGYLSYVAVTRDSTFHFAAAVCGGGYTDGDLAIQTSDTPIYATHRAGQAPWMSDEDGKDTWNRYGSPIHHMSNIKTPILILHGENDDVVHISHARSFHHGCLYRGVECELVVYPREGHGAFPPFERMHYIDTLKRMEKFYAKHLKGK
jgi:dipeptidyl aminopeptidase/acylaminoacyl peptidase